MISNGRLELGLGAGWRQSEQVSYGLPWESSAKARIQRLIETVEIIKGMWTNDVFSYTGRYYTIKDAVCNPKPVQKPHPRIWLAGKGEKLILKEIAKHADAWNADEISPQEYTGKLAVLRSYCELVGTDYESMEKSIENFVLISDKREELKRVADWSNWLVNLQAEYGERNIVTGTLEDMKARYILGSTRDVTERMSEYIDAGVQHFVLYFLDYPSTKSVELFTRDVIPSL